MRSFFVIGIFLLIWGVLAQGCMQFRMSDSKAIKKFAKDSVRLFTETVDINGFPIHYVRTGDENKPTLFFIHGSPGSWTAFESYLRDPELLKEYRMVAVDRPGFGYSDFGNAKNLKDQADLIAPLIKSLQNNQPIYLIGHSLGGPLAVKLAAEHPDCCNGIVLLAGSVDPAEEKPEKWRPVLMHTPLQWLIPGAMRPSNAELWYLKKDLVKLKTEFPKVTCPVWIIHGNKDILVPVGNASFAKKMLTDARKVDIKILSGENHFIPWTSYAVIKKELLNLQP